MLRIALRIVDVAVRVVVGALTVGLVVVNGRLYAAAEQRAEGFGSDVVGSLRFVGRTLREGGAHASQRFFPEGFFFHHVLYGLTSADVALAFRQGTPEREEAEREARWALAQLEGPRAREPFTESLDPPYGVFYAGWTAWLRGAIALTTPNKESPPGTDEALDVLARALDRSDSPFLEAYPNQAWPVDTVVAVSALALHEKIRPKRFRAAIDRWKARARAHGFDLLPHRVEPRTGKLVEGPRGTSQSMMARFLPEIDVEWGKTNYETFRARFLATPLGIPGILEYPIGTTGPGDVDSGPLVFGVSVSATVVTLAAARVAGDENLATGIANAGEAFGFGWESQGERRYAFGMLPVGDAFVAWSKVAHPFVAKLPEAAPAAALGSAWRLPFHAVSLLTLAIAWGPWWIPAARRRYRRRLAAKRELDPS